MANLNIPESIIADFFGAIENRDVGRLQSFVEQGIPVDIKNFAGKTGLQVSIYDNDVDTSTFLIESGADVTVPGHDGGSLLHDAAWSAGLTEMLLKRGVSPKGLNNEGLEPIHVASRVGSKGAIRLLCEAGADINKYSAAGYTPIHYQSENLDPELHDFMVDMGADQFAAGPFGAKLLHVVAQNPPYGLFASEPQSYIAHLVKQGFDLDEGDHFARRPLHYGAGRDDATITSALLRAGASPSSLDNMGKSPQDLASAFNREQLLMASRNEEAASLVSQSFRSCRPR
jgi:ankyrin repeat protein